MKATASSDETMHVTMKYFVLGAHNSFSTDLSYYCVASGYNAILLKRSNLHMRRAMIYLECSNATIKIPRYAASKPPTNIIYEHLECSDMSLLTPLNIKYK